LRGGRSEARKPLGVLSINVRKRQKKMTSDGPLCYTSLPKTITRAWSKTSWVQTKQISL